MTCSISFSSLPILQRPNQQLIRLLTREELQVLMDYLKQEHVPFYQDKQNASPSIPVQEISNYTQIKPRTIRNYIYRLSKDPEYNPYDNFHTMNRAMSDRLEEQLLLQIDTMYITPGFYFNNKTLKHLALALWEQAPPEDRLRPDFRASDGWCRRFRIRHGYVWRRARAARRPILTEKSKKIRKKYLRQVIIRREELEQQGKLHLLVNADETSWRLAYEGDLTWGKRGAKSVKLAVNYNLKKCLTAIATVSADQSDENYGKLPLYLIAKGKTNRCHKQLEGFPQYRYEIDHSPSGWTTIQVMARYLHWLRKYMNENYHAENEKISLILDVYRAHTDKQIRSLADQLNIDLFFIPAGATDIYQPLDRNIFGALKGKARGNWYERYAKNPNAKFNLHSATETLLKCWSELNSATISEAWKIYEEMIQEEKDDDCVTDTVLESIEETEKNITESLRKMRQMKNGDQAESTDHQSNDEEINDDEEEEVAEEEEIDDDDDDFESINFDDKIESSDEDDFNFPSNEQGTILQSQNDHPNDCAELAPTEAQASLVTNEHQEMSMNITFPPTQLTDDIQWLVAYEQEKILSRKNIAKAKKKGLVYPEVVGIANYQYTCAFNTFMQLVSLMPHQDLILQHPDDPLEISILNAICIIGKKYRETCKTINLPSTFAGHASLFLADKEQANDWARKIIQNINDKDHSVITFILDFIPQMLYCFIQYNEQGVAEEKKFLSIHKDTFVAGLNRIDVASLNSYLWIIRDEGDDISVEPFTFPLQVKLTDNIIDQNQSNQSVLLVLQAIVININQAHFEVFVRKSILDTTFIEVNDSIVEECELTSFIKQRPSIALYHVIHIT